MEFSGRSRSLRQGTAPATDVGVPTRMPPSDALYWNRRSSRTPQAGNLFSIVPWTSLAIVPWTAV